MDLDTLDNPLEPAYIGYDGDPSSHWWGNLVNGFFSGVGIHSFKRRCDSGIVGFPH